MPCVKSPGDGNPRFSKSSGKRGDDTPTNVAQCGWGPKYSHIEDGQPERNFNQGTSPEQAPEIITPPQWEHTVECESSRAPPRRGTPLSPISSPGEVLPPGRHPGDATLQMEPTVSLSRIYT